MLLKITSPLALVITLSVIILLSFGMINAYADWVGPDIRVEPTTLEIGEEFTITCKPSRYVGDEGFWIDYSEVGGEVFNYTAIYTLETKGVTIKCGGDVPDIGSFILFFNPNELFVNHGSVSMNMEQPTVGEDTEIYCNERENKITPFTFEIYKQTSVGLYFMDSIVTEDNTILYNFPTSEEYVVFCEFDARGGWIEVIGMISVTPTGEDTIPQDATELRLAKIINNINQAHEHLADYQLKQQSSYTTYNEGKIQFYQDKITQLELMKEKLESKN